MKPRRLKKKQKDGNIMRRKEKKNEKSCDMIGCLT